MIRVYISSTYRDLRPQRDAAAEAVRLLMGHPVRMEDYVASDERPVDRCLSDVRASDIYLGIVAWRYGFRPPGHTKSITRLEYEAAVEAGIPRLLFLHDEERKGKWPRKWIDKGEDERDLLAFRKEIGEGRLASFFADTPRLQLLVSAALSRQLGRMTTPGQSRVPQDLPYMADRSRQCDELSDAVEEHARTRPLRPLVVLIHGDEHEAHDAFLGRLERSTLPRLLRLPPDSKSIHRVKPDWGEPQATPAEKKRRFRQRLGEVVLGDGRAALPEIARRLAGHRCPVMVTSSVLAEKWNGDEGNLIADWLDLWNGWPDSPEGQTLLPVLNVLYKDVAGLSWTKRWAARRVNARVARFVERLDIARSSGFTAVKLHRLEPVEERHVMAWIESEAAAFVGQARGEVREPLVLAEKLKPCVREFFRRASRHSGAEGIPMEPLAIALRAELQRCLGAEGN